MRNHIKHAIIAYDISCPKRLGRIYRALCSHAMRLQYSVFYFTGTQMQLDTCLAEIVPLIDETQDDLRLYPLPSKGYQWRIGKATLPEGISYTGLPAAWQTIDNEQTPENTHTSKGDTKTKETPLQTIENKGFFIY